ncbi:two-component-system connector protein YcgZ [Escherichia coli]|uniref:regulatory protein YcgZ n=2 Tax=Escherichia coli TaxID=562 RepID=UPI0017BFC820|nr:two-component-system connector protein YcgZ [Escherichia coli]MBA8519116.1 two-component-system connector protein YcgZ [Escherichia coli]
MHQNSVTSDSAGAITRYFAKANLPTQQETLGEIVTEILKDGRNLSRKSLCAKLLCRLEQATGEEKQGNDSNLLIVFYVQIMPDDFVMQLHRF